MKRELSVVPATKAKIITPSLFNSYDACINPYVGCQFGCTYCYVRQMVKDPNYDWGEFVRVREHIEEKLPKELSRGYQTVPDGKGPSGTKKNKRVNNEDLRIVIGTMTDPYMPIERKHRVTRKTLEILIATKPKLNKVGIFTRSPIVLDDLDLISQLPRKRIHLTITPFPHDIIHLIEPIAIRTDRRWETIRQLKTAGIRCHVNVAPVIPVASDNFVTEFANKLAELKCDQFFVDPMQAYSESYTALKASMLQHHSWSKIESIMSDKEAYGEWKAGYRKKWYDAWDKLKHLSPNTLPIWSDHIHHTWEDMRTGEPMDRRRYGDDLD